MSDLPSNRANPNVVASKLPTSNQLKNDLAAKICKWRHMRLCRWPSRCYTGKPADDLGKHFQ